MLASPLSLLLGVQEEAERITSARHQDLARRVAPRAAADPGLALC
jgi:hypothetical protein